MLAAAEAAMDMAAEDDAARARNRARLYAPPGGTRRGAGRARPAAGGMDVNAARAMMAAVAAEDAKVTSRRSG